MDSCRLWYPEATRPSEIARVFLEVWECHPGLGKIAIPLDQKVKERDYSRVSMANLIRDLRMAGEYSKTLPKGTSVSAGGGGSKTTKAVTAFHT